jgi:hypothetical protein
MTSEPEPRLTLTTAELVTALLLPVRLALRDQEEVLGHKAPSQRIANPSAPDGADRVSPVPPPEAAGQPLPDAVALPSPGPRAESRFRMVPTRVQVRQAGSEPATPEQGSSTAGRLRPLPAGGTPPQAPPPAPAAESAQPAKDVPARAKEDTSRTVAAAFHASAPPHPTGAARVDSPSEAPVNSGSSFLPPSQPASAPAPESAAPRAKAPAAAGPVTPPAADPHLALAAPLHPLPQPNTAGLDAATAANPPAPHAERPAWWSLPRLPLAPVRGEAPLQETALPPHALEPDLPSTAPRSAATWTAPSAWSSFSPWSTSPWPIASPQTLRPGAPSADPPEQENAIPTGEARTVQEPLDPLQLEAALVRVLLASAQRHGVDLDP